MVPLVCGPHTASLPMGPQRILLGSCCRNVSVSKHRVIGTKGSHRLWNLRWVCGRANFPVMRYKSDGLQNDEKTELFRRIGDQIRCHCYHHTSEQLSDTQWADISNGTCTGYPWVPPDYVRTLFWNYFQIQLKFHYSTLYICKWDKIRHECLRNTHCHEYM